MTTKSCKGCKYLVNITGLESRCKAADGETQYVVDQYTGRGRYIYGFRPTVSEMRRGVCGEEAKLYAPTLFHKTVSNFFKVNEYA